VTYDIIKVFKITHKMYYTTVSPDLSFSERANTRGNNYKLHNHSFHYDLRKYFFSACIVMAALCNRGAIIFLPCSFFPSFYLLLLLSFFSSPNLSGRRLDVYHTLTHGVALVRI